MRISDAPAFLLSQSLGLQAASPCPHVCVGCFTISCIMFMVQGRTLLALQAALVLLVSPCFCFAPSCLKLRSHGMMIPLRSARPSILMSAKPQDTLEAKLSSISNMIFSGILGASLILSPGMVTPDSPVSYGGTAYAQGATSSKVTRGAPSVDANKDPESILRLSLPINPKNPIREAQV